MDSARAILRRAEAQAEGYEARIRQQRERIGVLVGFLEAKGLLTEFNTWEALRKAASEAAASGERAGTTTGHDAGDDHSTP